MIADLVAALGPLWHERHQAKLASRLRKRAVGAGAKHRLVFVDRLLATLVHLRHSTTHDVLACCPRRPRPFGRARTAAPGDRLVTVADYSEPIAPDNETMVLWFWSDSDH
ncbi:hypothetical protein [Streptomyces sp. NPDC046832]|uniref:hypothetical protein n=1 Tax=Streptomyces sp. NPDC046832 TaxID=3155020 RepID=UPI0033C9B294